jgi:hypothetical protein
MEFKFTNEAAYESKSEIIRATGDAVNIAPTLMDDAEFGVPVKTDVVTAYVYDDDDNYCLLIITGPRKAVEFYAASIYEQTGYPTSYSGASINGIDTANIEVIR